MINIVREFQASSETSKWLSQDASLLPSSIYYTVLIFNAIKYLGRSVFSQSFAENGSSSFVHGFTMVCTSVVINFCWYFHVSPSTANDSLYSRIEWQCSFTTNRCVYRVYTLYDFTSQKCTRSRLPSFVNVKNNLKQKRKTKTPAEIRENWFIERH